MFLLLFYVYMSLYLHACQSVSLSVHKEVCQSIATNCSWILSYLLLSYWLHFFLMGLTLVWPLICSQLCPRVVVTVKVCTRTPFWSRFDYMAGQFGFLKLPEIQNWFFNEAPCLGLSNYWVRTEAPFWISNEVPYLVPSTLLLTQY